MASYAHKNIALKYIKQKLINSQEYFIKLDSKRFLCMSMKKLLT